MIVVDAHSIADRLGVKPVTVRQWRRRGLGFPEPHVRLRCGPVWDWNVVETWARETGRLRDG